MAMFSGGCSHVSTSLRGLALCGLLSSPSLGNPEVFTCSLDVQGYELWFGWELGTVT